MNNRSYQKKIPPPKKATTLALLSPSWRAGRRMAPQKKSKLYKQVLLSLLLLLGT